MNTEIELRKQQATTRIVKAVFPNTTNHYDTLFGGTALALMDEVAFITATRFSRKRMVTVSSDKVDFRKAIPAGTILELIGTVAQVGRTSLKVKIEVFVEEMYADNRTKAMEGAFTLVALDEAKKPNPYPGYRGRESSMRSRGSKQSSPTSPLRVVSLVPSWTETLIEAGVNVVGRTRF